MDPLVAVFLGASSLTLLWIARRLVVLTQIDRNTRHWVEAIEQAPDHAVLPLPQTVPPHRLTPEVLKAQRSA